MNTNTPPRVRFRYISQAAALYETPPGYATSGSVGIDLRACLTEESADIAPGGRLAVPSGLAVEPDPANPQLLAGFVYSRSGLGAVQGLTVAQGVGVIDPDYRGEITVVLLNTSGETRTVRRGDRIAQLVIQKFETPELYVMSNEEFDALGETERGVNGYGSTGL